MNKETQLISQEEKPGFIISAVKYIGSNVFGFLFEQYINVMHSILSAAQTQMLSLVPEDSQIMDKYQQAQLMNEAINAAFQDPRVQESLKAFQQNIKDVIQPFLAELNELFEKEGETLEKSAVKVADKIARNSVNMAYNSALAAVESVPGVGTIMSLLSVLQGAVDTVSTVSSEGMKAYTLFMKAFLKVVGETSGPIVDTVENANKLFNGITDVRNELAENLAKIPRTNKVFENPTQLNRKFESMSSIINSPMNQINNKIGQFNEMASNLQKVASNVNTATSILQNPKGHLENLVKDQVNQATAPFRQTSFVGGRKKKRTIKNRRL